MTSVYNLLREACGISQLEAAECVHEIRLDTVKSWSSDRRPAPEWAINQLQSLLRRIRRAGEDYARQTKMAAGEPVFVLGQAHDDRDARACGFPSIAAQNQALAIAISLLPDDAEIRLVPRIPGAIAAPVMEREMMRPTKTDSDVLRDMEFDTSGQFYTAGAVNRRKYERLEAIGWVKGVGTNINDVVYYLTAAGRGQLSLIETARQQRRDGPSAQAPGGGQIQVMGGPRRHAFVRLEPGKEFRVDQQPFKIEAIEDNVITAKLGDNGEALLYADPVLLG